MSAQTSGLARHRTMVAARVALAAVGGYLLASLAIIVLASLLLAQSGAGASGVATSGVATSGVATSGAGASRADAVLTATLWSFVVYAAAVLYVFTARTVLRAALGLAGAGMALAAVQAGLRLLAT